MGLAMVIAFLLLVVAVIWFVVQYNAFIAMKNNIEKARSDIDVLLRQRHDELTKLVDAVRGYMKYEKDLLQKITELRAAFTNAKTTEERLKINEEINGVIPAVMAVVERYPELKADESVKHLMERITGLENEIADRREYYNNAVLNYNNAIAMFPSSIVAAIMNLQPEQMFKATEEERGDVKISF